VHADYKDIKPAVLIKVNLDRLFSPGDVFEVRIPKTKYGTIAGYFNDTAIAAALIAKENGKHSAIYTTVNPINPALLARAANKFTYGAHETTSDVEVLRRRWLLVDLDPVRAAGISSTQHELELAIQKAEDIAAWLTNEGGWPEPLIAHSGNGAHLMYATDEPNDEETRAEYEFATKMLASLFSDEHVHVDTSVWNAARIWKLYGTIAAKGSDTKERPHRVARVLRSPSNRQIVPRALIRNLADSFRNSKSEEFRDMTGEFISDMHKWLADRGQTVVNGPRPLYGSEGRKWLLAKCPFNQNHGHPMVGLHNNRPIYRCLHNSCSAFHWREFREKIDPTYKDPETVYTRLKEWCEGEAEDIDPELLDTAYKVGRKLDQIVGRLKKEVPRPRFLILQDTLKKYKRKANSEQFGENNEKGNILGLIARTRMMQQEGVIPMYWIAEHDERIRVGDLGDVQAPRYDEIDDIQLMMKFHGLGDIWVKAGHAAQIIKQLASEYRVNPLKIYLEKFVWDGTLRLDTWLINYIGTKDTIYTRAIGRKWLISAVARAMEPGCQADHMLILEGAQGIGKSRALRILGGDFYVEFSGILGKNASNHKDMVAAITGKMIVEMSELAALKRADMESLKALLTTPHDDVRLAYARDSKTYPRTCIFAGTTNEVGQAYITDLTGARRFWPVHAGEANKVQSDALRGVRDQLWAEAVEAYKDGEDWWNVPAEEVAAEQADRQATIEATDPWYLILRQSLTSVDSYENQIFTVVQRYEDGMPTRKFSVRAGALHQILGIVLQIEINRQTSYDADRVRRILKVLGFKKSRPKKGGPDGSYAYDISQEMIPHLWSAIEAAVQEAKTKPDFLRTEKSGDF
jgi:hypothetical protein